MDWYHPDCEKDFPKHLRYLRDSVELLCKSYGHIGGFWFDSMWHKPDDFILRDGNSYYLFCYNLPMLADPNVAFHTDAEHMSKFCLPGKLMSACWLDNGAEVMF